MDTSEKGTPAAMGVPCDRARILVVDDEQPIVKLFKSIISVSMPGFTVDVALNGKEALQLFLDSHHGVVLLDLHMPVMDGRRTFLEIEQQCRDRRWEMPAVVFCTGYAPPTSIAEVVTGDSAHRLLRKPVKAGVLVSTIRECLA